MKKDENNTVNKKKSYSHFKTLKLDVSGPMSINIVQANFDSFWRQINKIDAKPQAKIECLNKLREACFWMCRGVAEYHEAEQTE